MKLFILLLSIHSLDLKEIVQKKSHKNKKRKLDDTQFKNLEVRVYNGSMLDEPELSHQKIDFKTTQTTNSFHHDKNTSSLDTQVQHNLISKTDHKSDLGDITVV